ncbi:MAG: metal-sulfur cluster assembly factor [Planctomycetaceae bacterium]
MTDESPPAESQASTPDEVPPQTIPLETPGHADSPATGVSDLSPGDHDELIDALRQVVDPELFINIVDLGLIYEIERAERAVTVNMTLTSPACPAGPQIMQQSKMVLEKLDGVDEARIKLVMSPPWSPDRMTDEARDQLGIF